MQKGVFVLKKRKVEVGRSMKSENLRCLRLQIGLNAPQDSPAQQIYTYSGSFIRA